LQLIALLIDPASILAKPKFEADVQIDASVMAALTALEPELGHEAFNLPNLAAVMDALNATVAEASQAYAAWLETPVGRAVTSGPGWAAIDIRVRRREVLQRLKMRMESDFLTAEEAVERREGDEWHHSGRPCAFVTADPATRFNVPFVRRAANNMRFDQLEPAVIRDKVVDGQTMVQAMEAWETEQEAEESRYEPDAADPLDHYVKRPFTGHHLFASPLK
jgi:hypothetical protein